MWPGPAGYTCPANSRMTLCPAGYACPGGALNASAVKCGANQYSAAGASVCSDCPAGQWAGASPGGSSCTSLCPNGWTYYYDSAGVEGRDSCVLLPNAMVPWTSAAAACRCGKQGVRECGRRSKVDLNLRPCMRLISVILSLVPRSWAVLPHPVPTCSRRRSPTRPRLACAASSLPCGAPTCSLSARRGRATPTARTRAGASGRGWTARTRAI